MEIQVSKDQTRELRSILNTLLSGTPENSSGSTEEYHQVNLLVGTISGYEVGDYDTSEVKEIFAANPVPGFDVLLWIQSKVDEGVYSHPTEID